MRVVMIVRQFFPWVGGTERQAQKLSARLIELGVDVRVVTGWWFWKTPREEVIETVPVFRNFTCWNMFNLKGLRKFAGYTYILSLFWYLWKHRAEYDVIHIHLLNYHAFPAVLSGRWLGKRSLIKMANSGQGSDIRRMHTNVLPGQKQMLPVTLKADRLVAINEESIGELRAAGVPSERIIVIPNGVETNGHYKSDYQLNNTVVVLFVGRLHPNKGLDILLPACQSVIRRRPELQWQLWLVGDGPLRGELEQLAEKLQISQAVKFWGQVKDVTPYLAQADIFVLPSRTEGISNALLEAMAYGLPCVATCIGGNTDLIMHNENGLLVNPESEVELAEAVTRLADDEILRLKIGRSARQRIEANYSINHIARRYIELYQTLLECK
jgi:glycosyltransferase involved in cell wall biosynthesis